MKPEDSKGAITETVSKTRKRRGRPEEYDQIDYRGVEYCGCANKTKRTKQNVILALHAVEIIGNSKNWPVDWSVETRTGIASQFEQHMQYLLKRQTILAAVGRIKDPAKLSAVAFSIAFKKLKGAQAYALIRQHRGGMKFHYPDIGKKMTKLVNDFTRDYPGASFEWVKLVFDQAAKHISDWLASEISKSGKNPPG